MYHAISLNLRDLLRLTLCIHAFEGFHDCVKHASILQHSCQYVCDISQMDGIYVCYCYGYCSFYWLLHPGTYGSPHEVATC